jgi:hypothetical protein
MSESEWTRSHDYAALLHAAACTINDALKDGESTGKHAGHWRNTTVEEQLKHIEAHITQYQCGDRGEDHLAHIVCRAAIACVLARRAADSVNAERSRS